MSNAPIPFNEAARLRALYNYNVLDSMNEQGFDDITHLAGQLSECPMALISLVDATRQWFKSKIGIDASETDRNLSFCAHAIAEPRKPFIVRDASKDPRFCNNALVEEAPGIRFYAGIPLVMHDGHALGTLCVIDTKPRDISADQLNGLQVLAQSVVTALELRLMRKTVADLALCDPLTGLPNRAAVLSCLAKSMARQKRDQRAFAVIHVNLDDMKRVNEAAGFEKGDELLKAAAGALACSVRSEDNVGRLGGDEFAAIVDVVQLDHVERIALRIRNAIAMATRACGHTLTASIGAALFLEAPANECSALNTADALTYAAKASGKNQQICRAITNVWAEGAALIAHC